MEKKITEFHDIVIICVISCVSYKRNKNNLRILMKLCKQGQQLAKCVWH